MPVVLTRDSFVSLSPWELLAMPGMVVNYRAMVKGVIYVGHSEHLVSQKPVMILNSL